MDNQKSGPKVKVAALGYIRSTRNDPEDEAFKFSGKH
jgi:hypothetical protein